MTINMACAHNSLHLPSLSIRGFAGINDLSVSRLGRVTLFTGKNAVGKTTVLDAIRVYAARGDHGVLTSLLRKREEITDTEDDDGTKVLGPNWEALFYGRTISNNTMLSIGPALHDDTHFSITVVDHRNKELENHFPSYMLREGAQFLQVIFNGDRRYSPMLTDTFSGGPSRGRNRVSLERTRRNRPEEIVTEWLGPGLPSNEHMARFWDKVALTDKEARIVQALNLIFHATIERVAMIGSERASRYGNARRAVVRVKGESQPVPLTSLGDGATRLFGIALALANSQNGFLLIDEAENGIHHSVHHDLWAMIMRTAHENNVQVFATTHGWDCVVGYASAAVATKEVDGSLVRIERDREDLIAVEYSEKNLRTASLQRVEVRGY